MEREERGERKIEEEGQGGEKAREGCGGEKGEGRGEGGRDGQRKGWKKGGGGRKKKFCGEK